MSALIPLYQRGQVVAHAKVDADTCEALGHHRWLLSAHGYAVRYEGPGGRTCIRMSREILGLVAGDSRQGDHINRDRLDNRRVNLRIVTSAENSQNVSRRRGRFRGVSFHKASGRWHARVKLDGRTHSLGYHDSEEAAGTAAAAFRAEHMPFADEKAAAA